MSLLVLRSRQHANVEYHVCFILLNILRQISQKKKTHEEQRQVVSPRNIENIKSSSALLTTHVWLNK